MPSFAFPTFSFRNYAHVLTVAMIGASVIYGLLGVYGSAYLLFNPVAVWRGLQIWRPFTALLIAASPLEVVFGGLIIYQIGGNIEGWVGKRRFLLLALGIPLVSLLATSVISLLAPGLFSQAYYAGATIIITTLWILFGLMVDRTGQNMSFWGAAVTGKTFAFFGLGFVLLQGIFNSWLSVVPDLIAAGICYAHMSRSFKFEIFETIETALDKWKLRRLKAKRGLKVVTSNKGKPFRDDDLPPNVH